MRFRAWRVQAWAPLVLAGLAWALAGPAAGADDETPVETVAGYQISRVNTPKDAYPCRMVRGYADPADNNAANALGFGQLDDTFIVSLVYERWKWEAGKTVKARLSIDRTLIDADAQWLGNATYLAIKVPMVHLPAFKAGKKIILGFKDGDADFDLTGFKPAFEAVVRCNREAAATKAVQTKPVDAKPVDAKPIDSGIAAKAPPAAPAPPARPAVAAPAGPLPSEDRAVVYLFALYDRWAFDVCDMRTTARQRQALEAKAAALKPEMGAIEADLQKQVQGDPSRCPPAAMLEKQLGLLIDATPEDFLAKMDERAVREFRGIVRPILARLKPPEPAPSPPAPAQTTAKAQLPSEARIGAYVMGLNIQDAIQRCDIATTARQRTAIATKMEALGPEMAEIEAAGREAIDAKVCPGPGEAEAVKAIAELIALFVEKTPEDFTAAWDRKTDGVFMGKVKKVVEKVRPPEPSTARMATFLWGLVLQDKLAQCDIATTARQRAGLEGRIASLRAELAAYESALREQIKGQVQGCPAPDKTAEFLSVLPLFIEGTPEEFAAEMDRRTARTKGAAASPEKAAPAPTPPAPAGAASKPPPCGGPALSQTPAEFAAALKQRLAPFGVRDLVATDARKDHHRYALKGADVGIDLDGSEGKVTAIYVNQDGDGSKREVEIALAITAYAVAAFTRGPETTVGAEMKTRLGAAPVSAGHSEKFGTATVFYTRPDGGNVTMLIDNADAGECKP